MVLLFCDEGLRPGSQTHIAPSAKWGLTKYPRAALRRKRNTGGTWTLLQTASASCLLRKIFWVIRAAQNDLASHMRLAGRAFQTLFYANINAVFRNPITTNLIQVEADVFVKQEKTTESYFEFISCRSSM